MNNRDLEFLSSYLDGQLNPNESARLEARINSDPELFSALADLRTARNILRKLPQRKAPRNFTLTRKMVGINPPLPRSYSFFKFSTAFASLLLVLTFAANLFAPRLNSLGNRPALPASLMAAATEAPAMGVAPFVSQNTERSVSTAEAPMGKSMVTEQPAQQDQPQVKKEARVPIGWQVTFLMVAIIGVAVMFVIRQSAKRKWQ